MCEYWACENCANHSENIRNENKKCQLCKVKVGEMRPTKWQAKLTKTLEPVTYIAIHVNFDALRTEAFAKKQAENVSNQAFALKVGKTWTSFISWCREKRISRENYRDVCAWLDVNATRFLNKDFKKRRPYYAKSYRCRIPGRAAK